METKQLMINDWVYDKKARKNTQVIQIGLWYIQCVIHTDTHHYDFFEPIPLTEEILRENGFQTNNPFNKEYTYKDYIAFNSYRFVSVMVDDCENRFNLSITNKTPKTETKVGMNIKYVHQLQHALRLCGLNELADNFKV